MLWEALIGGAVGGLLGGPWGMAAGAALGAGLDVFRDRVAPPLDGVLTAAHHDDGLLLTATLSEPIPEGGFALFEAFDHDENRLAATDAAQRFANRWGHFQLTTSVHDGGVRAFLPFGVVDSGSATLDLRLRVFGAPEPDELDLIGELRVTVDWPQAAYSAARFWRPLLGLCMAVAHADGAVDRGEVRLVRQRVAAGLGIPVEEIETVTEILRTEPSASLVTLIDALRLRAPRLQARHVIGALADVAHADGAVSPEEVAMIRAVGAAMGVSPSHWRAWADEMGLEPR
ncbi:MAG: TerB family tellurite resistance protein [Myxococcota bacterium]